MYVSRWQRAYNRYRELYRVWPGDLQALLSFRISTFNSQERTQEWEKSKEAYRKAKGIDIEAQIKVEWVEWADEVREEIAETQRYPDMQQQAFPAKKFYPYEDVYQAALFILASEYSENERYVYRGQRCYDWKTTPSIFRTEPGRELTDDELKKRKNYIIAFAESLKKHYPGRFATHELYAVTQHYMGGTWLIDLTRSPWVALFFASDWSDKSCDASRSNDIGVVWSFRTKEWERMSPNGALGKMTYIEPVNVKRIANQKALFLDGSHPYLIAQYMSSPVSFYQQPGVVFEDEAVGVTRSLIYPEEDELNGFAEGWKEGWDQKGKTFPISLKTLMGGRAYRKWTVESYAHYIMKLLKQRATDSLPAIKLETPEVLRLVNQLACFHYHLTEIQHDRRPAVSLHELTDVIDKFLIEMGRGHLPTCDSLIKGSYKDFSWKIIDQAMRECSGST